MSRFYASIQGNRGEATRQGTAKSGLYGHIRGWDVGAVVNCFVNDKGEDVVEIVLTSGSNGRGRPNHLGSFKREDLDKPGPLRLKWEYEKKLRLCNTGDPETDHRQADMIVMDFLREMGCGTVASVFDAIHKWYV
jgi:hypothetical protein